MFDDYPLDAHTCQFQVGSCKLDLEFCTLVCIYARFLQIMIPTRQSNVALNTFMTNLGNAVFNISLNLNLCLRKTLVLSYLLELMLLAVSRSDWWGKPCNIWSKSICQAACLSSSPGSHSSSNPRSCLAAWLYLSLCSLSWSIFSTVSGKHHKNIKAQRFFPQRKRQYLYSFRRIWSKVNKSCQSFCWHIFPTRRGRSWYQLLIGPIWTTKVQQKQNKKFKRNFCFYILH